MSIQLRPTIAADVPNFFEFQLDPEGNRLAGTKPRDLAKFNAIWERILADPIAAAVTPRTILAGDTIAGTINIFPRDGKNYIGYWLAREHWGRGIATRAVALLIAEFTPRPLFAQIAAHNVASLKALQRSNFTIISQEFMPETERYTPGEVITLTLTS